MVSTSFMVDTSSHPRAQLHRCVERSAYGLRRPGPGLAPAGGYIGGAKHMSAKGYKAVRSEGAKAALESKATRRSSSG